ncbi:putative dimethyladenosine transferase [Dorcoceras hygrometricum]|uniref:Putative dimethyladenosine transferase n=1 Tax=Dorcoceras hygrometricum TaxID=472368 RepID=A0A2Z7A5H6_9LAMI|nr:putative dimethyladenosine transferase [Dorcoceras hygrometricum]
MSLELVGTTAFCIRNQQMKSSAKVKRRRMEKQPVASYCSSAGSYSATSRGYLELAIAKRCRLHKLIRQRFALALKIQQEDFALITSRKIQSRLGIQAQEEKKQAKHRRSTSRKIQSQDFSRSAREAAVDLNQQRSS